MKKPSAESGKVDEPRLAASHFSMTTSLERSSWAGQVILCSPCALRLHLFSLCSDFENFSGPSKDLGKSPQHSTTQSGASSHPRELPQRKNKCLGPPVVRMKATIFVLFRSIFVGECTPPKGLKRALGGPSDSTPSSWVPCALAGLELFRLVRLQLLAILRREKLEALGAWYENHRLKWDLMYTYGGSKIGTQNGGKKNAPNMEDW